MANQEVRDALEEIATRSSGVLRAEDVVQAAAAMDHPLHRFFTWDDAAAAHAHRIDQARELIRSVRVQITTETRKISSVFYVRDPLSPPDRQGYVSLPRMRTERELAVAAVANEFAQIAAALERVRGIAISVGLTDRAQLAEWLLTKLGEVHIKDNATEEKGQALQP